MAQILPEHWDAEPEEVFPVWLGDGQWEVDKAVVQLVLEQASSSLWGLGGSGEASRGKHLHGDPKGRWEAVGQKAQVEGAEAGRNQA